MGKKMQLIWSFLGIISLSPIWSLSKVEAPPPTKMIEEESSDIDWTVSVAYLGGYLTYGSMTLTGFNNYTAPPSGAPMPETDLISYKYAWGNGFDLSCAFTYPGAENFGLLADYSFFTVGSSSTTLSSSSDNIIVYLSAGAFTGYPDYSSYIATYSVPYLQRADLLINCDFFHNKVVTFSGLAGLDGFFLNHKINMTNVNATSVEKLHLKEVVAGAGPKVGMSLTALFRETFGVRGNIGISAPITSHSYTFRDPVYNNDGSSNYYMNTKGTYSQMHQIVDAELDLVYHYSYGETSNCEALIGWRTFQAPTMSNLSSVFDVLSAKATLDFSALVVELKGTF